MENSMWTIEKMKIKKNIVNNIHLLTESQRLPNMLGQRLYNMLGQRLYNMLGQRLYNMLGQHWYNMVDQRLYNMLAQRLYNMLGQHFLDEQSEDGFASRNQRWPNENCSLKPNVGPTSTCYLGYSKNIYSDVRIGQAMLRPAESELRSDGWRSPD